MAVKGLSGCCKRNLALVIRQLVIYLKGGVPRADLNRSMNRVREMPTCLASCSIDQLMDYFDGFANQSILEQIEFSGRLMNIVMTDDRNKQDFCQSR